VGSLQFSVAVVVGGEVISGKDFFGKKYFLRCVVLFPASLGLSYCKNPPTLRALLAARSDFLRPCQQWQNTSYFADPKEGKIRYCLNKRRKQVPMAPEKNSGYWQGRRLMIERDKFYVFSFIHRQTIPFGRTERHT
jgi:hypothetical protein